MKNHKVEVTDSRSVTRDDCQIEAGISLGDGHKPIFCMIRNMSVTGAMIKIAHRTFLPHDFDLLIPVFVGVNETRRCKLRWRVDNVVGVSFVDHTPSEH